MKTHHITWLHLFTLLIRKCVLIHTGLEMSSLWCHKEYYYLTAASHYGAMIFKVVCGCFFLICAKMLLFERLRVLFARLNNWWSRWEAAGSLTRHLCKWLLNNGPFCISSECLKQGRASWASSPERLLSRLLSPSALNNHGRILCLFPCNLLSHEWCTIAQKHPSYFPPVPFL